MLILSVVFNTFFKINTSNKKYMLKNESIYPLRKFQEIPPILRSLVEGDVLFYLFFTLSFIL